MIELLERCVRIPSPSGQEQQVALFLRDEMLRRGFDRAYIDEVGNVVGVIGSGNRQFMLLGHMDTVSGEVPVRYQDGKLYGRGTVDAKGPLCAFVLAAEALQTTIRHNDAQVIVVGAVEEECASSRGARHVAQQYRPDFCVIGEPSGTYGITLGYKGRLLISARIEQPMRHTAVPEPSACEIAVSLWNHVVQLADAWNAGKSSTFDQILPSLRRLQSGDDGLREWCEILIGARLPLGYGPPELRAAAEQWQAAQAAQQAAITMRFEAAEPAWRVPRDTALARAFVEAVRAMGMRPAFKLKTGTSDFNVVGPAWQCPLVAYGPGDSSLDHTPDEHVVIEEFEKSVAILTRALRSLLTDITSPA